MKKQLKLIIGIGLIVLSLILLVVGIVANLHLWDYHSEFWYDSYSNTWYEDYYDNYEMWWSYLYDITNLASLIVGIVFIGKHLKEQVKSEDETELEKEDYVESRFGAIELYDDYFIVYSNFIPLKCAKIKRDACIIYYDQLVNASFMPAGWLKGTMKFWSKSCMRQRADNVIHFGLYLPSSSRKISKQYEMLYNKIVEKIHANKKELRENANKTMLY